MLVMFISMLELVEWIVTSEAQLTQKNKSDMIFNAVV